MESLLRDVRAFADFLASKLLPGGGFGEEIAPGLHLVLRQVQRVQVPLGDHPWLDETREVDIIL